ncbi:MAG: hypothetical protein ACE5GW_08450, partial [Planctomycetota bacterium]
MCCFLALLLALPLVARQGTEAERHGDGDSAPPAGGRVAAAEEIQRWITALGSGRWAEREEAMRRLLESGQAAVSFLRAERDSDDPERRSRVRWLLSHLDPHLFEVDLARLAAATADSPEAPVEIKEGLTLELGEGRPGGAAARALSGEGERFSIAVIGDRAPFRVTTRFGVENTSVEITRSLADDGLAILRHEELEELEDHGGRLRLTHTPSLWVIHLREKKRGAGGLGSAGGTSLRDPLTDRDRMAKRLERALKGGLHSGDITGALACLSIAGHWRRGDLLPSGDEVPRQLRPALWLARLQAGETAAVPLLEAWVSGFAGGEPEDPDEILLFREAVAHLTRLGSPLGIEQILAGIEEYASWEQHQAFRSIADRLDAGTLEEKDARRVLGALLRPGASQQVAWRDSITPALIQALQDRLPSQAFADTFLPALEDGLSPEAGGAGNRLRMLLRFLLRLLRAQEIEQERWFPPVFALLETMHFTDAFAVILDARLNGRLGDESWEKVLDRLTSNYQASRQNLLFHTQRAVERLLASDLLTDESRRKLWLAGVECLTIPQWSQRSQIDTRLEKQFGTIVKRRPARIADEEWRKRAATWREKITGAPVEDLRPRPWEAAPLRLTTVDFRVDEDRGEATYLGFRSRSIEVGTAELEIAPDLSDVSVVLEEHSAFAGRSGSATSYRLMSGTTLTLGRPELRNLVSRSRHTAHLITSSGFGPEATSRRRNVFFRSLLLLEEEAEGDDPAESGVGSPEGWPGFRERLIRSSHTLSGMERRTWLVIIGKLRLTEALPPLRALFEREPSVELARTLLQLGDHGGRELLL